MNKRILRLAIPNIISNITIPLLGIVDLSIVGHLGNDFMIGGMAVGSAIFNFIYWGFAFLRMGTSGFASQAYGARQLSESARVLVRAVVVAMAVALVLLVLQRPILELSLGVLDAPGESNQWARQYFMYRIWAAPATLSLYAVTGWMIGMQNSKSPMWIAILINVVNVGASLFFALGAGMGLAGVALGTTIAQWCGLGFAGVIIYRYYGRLFREPFTLSMFAPRYMMRFLSVNSNIFIRTACLISVFTFFTATSGKMGNQTLAANTLLLQLFTLFSYMMDGFAYAVEALSGKYYGAGNAILLRKSVGRTIAWGAGLACCFTFIYMIFGNDILRIFTDSPQILAEASSYLWWAMAVPLAGFLAFTLDGVMVGISASAIMRNSMLIATIIFFVTYYYFVDSIQNDALWMSLIVFLILRGLLELVLSYCLIFGKLTPKEKKMNI